MEFIAPEAALPPQVAGFLMSIVGMVIGSLLTKDKSPAMDKEQLVSEQPL